MTEKDMIDQCYSLVLTFFKNDKKKTDLWFKCGNPHLGGASPNKMIEKGRVEKLLKFIRGCAAEGGWSEDFA